MKTVRTISDKGTVYEEPMLFSFSHTVGGKSYHLAVHKFEGAVPGTVFPDPSLYTVTDIRSGRKVVSCRHRLREGVLGAAQAAVDALVKRVGAARFCRVMDAAPALPEKP